MDSAILIDDNILKLAIGDRYQVGIDKMVKIHFDEIPQLYLENSKIVKIDHLDVFKSLTRLDLQHNLIGLIEGLDCLINLTWLNLSFNSIEKIEGLEALQKLEMLNLTNNRISVIENMDTLKKLTHFYIANNLIGQWDNVLYLRRFENLFTLNLSGNPFAEADDYTFSIAAYFPNLVFLDYRKLDEKTKNEAAIKFHYAIEEMERKELQMQQAEEAKRSQEAEVKLHTDAFVEHLNGSYLFKSMLKDDPEAETLHAVPEVAQVLQTFEHQMVELCTQLFGIGLDEHKRRESEVKSSFSGLNEGVTDYQHKTFQVLSKFVQQHRQRMLELQDVSDPDLLKVKINHCKDEISQLSNRLMALEFELSSQMEDIIKKLDTNISGMVDNFSETAQEIFAQCRDLEDNYYEKLQATAVTLENVAKENLDEDMSDHVKMLLADRDSVLDALATGHDNHLLKLNDRETQLVTRIGAWKVALIKEIQDKELKRNRIRISDIHNYVDNLSDQLEELQ